MTTILKYWYHLLTFDFFNPEIKCTTIARIAATVIAEQELEATKLADIAH